MTQTTQRPVLSDRFRKGDRVAVHRVNGHSFGFVATTPRLCDSLVDVRLDSGDVHAFLPRAIMVLS